MEKDQVNFNEMETKREKIEPEYLSVTQKLPKPKRIKIEGNFNEIEVKKEVIEGNFDDNSDLKCESTDVKEEVESDLLGLTQKLPKPKKIKNEEKKRKIIPKNFKCDECDKAFSARSQLSKHKNAHEDLECKTCGRKFQKKGFLDKHKCSICEICNKRFNKSQQLTQHMESHKLENRIKFECDFCGKILIQKISLFRHMMEFHARIKKPFKCDLCSKDFVTKTSLRAHMYNHFKANCDICDKLLITNKIKDHIKQIHGNDYNFKCEKCPKMFKTRQGLRQHLATHIKRLSCKICETKFRKRRNLVEHQALHNNPNAFQCKICRKNLSNTKNLKIHVQINHGDKKDLKYQCEKCEYATQDKMRMKNHQKVHEKYEEKLKSRSDWFKCQKCPTLLSTESYIKKHMQAVHGRKVECDLCGSKLKFNKQNLTKHFKKIHKEKF